MVDTTRRQFLLGTTALVASTALGVSVMYPPGWREIRMTSWSHYEVKFDLRVAGDSVSQSRLTAELVAD